MSRNKLIMIKKIIKYYSFLIFLTITFLPNLSNHNEYLNIFYSSRQYDLSIIFLLMSIFILQFFRLKYYTTYRECLWKIDDKIFFLLFLVTTIVSLYFFYQAINDYYFLNFNVK